MQMFSSPTSNILLSWADLDTVCSNSAIYTYRVHLAAMVPAPLLTWTLSGHLLMKCILYCCPSKTFPLLWVLLFYWTASHCVVLHNTLSSDECNFWFCVFDKHLTSLQMSVESVAICNKCWNI